MNHETNAYKHELQIDLMKMFDFFTFLVKIKQLLFLLKTVRYVNKSWQNLQTSLSSMSYTKIMLQALIYLYPSEFRTFKEKLKRDNIQG